MSGQIRDAVQQSSLGRSTKEGGGDVFWRVCKRPDKPNLLYTGLSQVVYPAAGLFKGSSFSIGHQQSRHSFLEGKNGAKMGLPLFIGRERMKG